MSLYALQLSSSLCVPSGPSKTTGFFGSSCKRTGVLLALVCFVVLFSPSHQSVAQETSPSIKAAPVQTDNVAPPFGDTKPAGGSSFLFSRGGSSEQRRLIEFRKKEPADLAEQAQWNPGNHSAGRTHAWYFWLFPVSFTSQRTIPQPLSNWSEAEGLPWDVTTHPIHDPMAGMTDDQKREYRIAMLRHEILEKQSHAELLLRLFVKDEKDYWIGIPRWKANGGERRVIHESVEMRTNALQLKALEKNLRALEEEQSRATIAQSR